MANKSLMEKLTNSLPKRTVPESEYFFDSVDPTGSSAHVSSLHSHTQPKPDPNQKTSHRRWSRHPSKIRICLPETIYADPRVQPRPKEKYRTNIQRWNTTSGVNESSFITYYRACQSCFFWVSLILYCFCEFSLYIMFLCFSRYIMFCWFSWFYTFCVAFLVMWCFVGFLVMSCFVGFLVMSCFVAFINFLLFWWVFLIFYFFFVFFFVSKQIQLGLMGFADE